MAVWKVLLICLSACVCMGLATASFIIPLGLTGNERWLWLAGLVAATFAAIGLFALLLRHVGSSMDVKRGGARR